MAENGTDIDELPVIEDKPCFDHLIGMFSGGGTAVDEFLDEKYNEKGL